jgi:hypothetical protein
MSTVSSTDSSTKNVGTRASPTLSRHVLLLTVRGVIG